MAVEKKKDGKRKYGQPRSPQGERAMLMANNKKMRQSQACDRCRLKKIKCDGMKPSCSQCTKVNFACRTSDRLTRRGFPRGYTEMLETEVVRLQKLLDGKGVSIEPVLEEGAYETGGSISSSSGNNTSNKNDDNNNRNNNTNNYEEGDIKPLITPSSNSEYYSQEDEKISSPSINNNNKSSGDGELGFAFVNDTFHYYNNYRREENYMGNSTWNVLTGSLSTRPNEEAVTSNFETDCFISYQLSAMKNILHLDSNFSFLPKFLLVKYDYNIPKLLRLLKIAITDFGNFENSLVPILYPFDKWETKFSTNLIQLQKRDQNDSVNNDGNEEINPISLLTLLYIIQLNWSCFNDFKLFQLTKMVCLSSKTRLETLQCILLASFYFMGGQSSSIIHHLTDNSQVWATELLHIAYSMVLNLGLYVNSKRMISLQIGNQEIPHQHQRVVVFWVFQFLDSWWSLLQGLPKANFLVDEFHPQSLKSLNIPALTPFVLLLNFTTDSLDGCNLLHTLTGNNSISGRSKLIYVTESFRHLLVKWKLYHQIQDHEEKFGLGNEDVSHMSTTLTKADMVEIQLTLVYLVISFLSNERFTNLNGNGFSLNSIDSENIPLHGSNLEELSYEVLSLYSLVLMDHTRLEQPQQLKILHLLPCNNRDIIRLCLSTLNNWGMSVGGNTELDGRLHWKFHRYQNMVNQWCKFYLVDKLEDPLLQQLIISFKLNLNDMSSSGTNGQTFNNWNEIEYLQNVDMFNGNPQVFTKAQLLRSNPHAVMEQFDIFASISGGGRPIFNEVQPANLQQNHSPSFSGMQSANDINKPKSNISEHDSFNIIDMSKYRSQILISNDETDDGYAEDDDEDDEDGGGSDGFSKPLEIPLCRRTGSLFQRNYNSNNHDNNNSNDNSNGNKMTLHGDDVGRPRRHTLDHSFLNQSTNPDVGHSSETASGNNQQEELAPLQDRRKKIDSRSSHGTVSLQNYAFDALDNKRNRSQSVSVPPNSNLDHELITSASASQTSAGTQYNNEVLFGDFVSVSPHDSRTSHNQIVETPRTLVDMLMLPPSNNQPTQVVNPSSTLTTSNANMDHNGLYKKT